MTRRNINHWCKDCHGFTGPGSPCYDGPEDDEELDPDTARQRQQDAQAEQAADSHYEREADRGRP